MLLLMNLEFNTLNKSFYSELEFNKRLNPFKTFEEMKF